MKPLAKIKWCALALALAPGCAVFADGGTNAVAPVTARDFYNVGTGLLGAKQFAEAEQMFEASLAAQDEHVQPAALYNLGDARFDDGEEALKKKPDAGSAATTGNTASAEANFAIRRAQSALADDDVSQMVAAYLEGGGARRNVTAAEEIVQQAMETYGDTLRKWQRAAEDFKSAAELDPADTNASRNAKIVEQHIAKLVDSLRQMQHTAAMLGGQHSQLNDLLAQLAGRIPKGDLPPGVTGEGEEDEGIQPESLRGLKEGATQEGGQIEAPLSPDEAAQILNGILPEGDHRLPVNEEKAGQPKKTNSRDW